MIRFLHSVQKIAFGNIAARKVYMNCLINFKLILLTGIVLKTVDVLGDSCPDGFVKHVESCYIVITEMPADWIEAVDFCKDLNGKLLEIESASENNFIGQQLQKLAHQPEYWIGGTDGVIENEWRWISNENEFGFKAWGPGEPNDYRTKEDCATVFLSGSHLYWNDDRCEKKLSFICEKERNTKETEEAISKTTTA